MNYNFLEPLRTDGFGDWLSGFIDGEGCFLIPYRSDRDHWMCQFRIRVRADDMDIIKEIHERTGIGRVFLHQQKESAPLACWEVSSRADCVRLVKILDEFPLRAKKSKDFKTWRHAVEVWETVSRGGDPEHRRVANTVQWAQLKMLAQRLRAERRYTEAVA